MEMLGRVVEAAAQPHGGHAQGSLAGGEHPVFHRICLSLYIQ
jgi:hypothetical protein